MKLDIPSNSMIIEPHIREAILDYYKLCGISFDFRAQYDTSCALKGYLVSLRKTIIPRKGRYTYRVNYFRKAVPLIMLSGSKDSTR